MTEFAAAFFVMWAVVLTLVLLLGGIVGIDHKDIAQKCSAHHGVAQIANSWMWKDKTMVVCRDGSVWSGK